VRHEFLMAMAMIIAVFLNVTSFNVDIPVP
jgi:hypothetical protein